MSVSGLSCKLYRNTGTYGGPTWSEIENVKDVTINQTSERAEADRRAKTFKRGVATLKDVSIDFDMVYVSGDADWTTLKTAWINGTEIEFAAVNGPIATSGTKGIRATLVVTDFTISQALNGVETAKVKLEMGDPDNDPSEISV